MRKIGIRKDIEKRISVAYNKKVNVKGETL